MLNLQKPAAHAQSESRPFSEAFFLAFQFGYFVLYCCITLINLISITRIFFIDLLKTFLNFSF